MFCANCGSKVLDGVKFCSNCGVPIDSGKSTYSNQQEAVSAIREEQSMSNELVLASFGQRLWAFLVDLVILMFLSFIVFVLILMVFYGGASDQLSITTLQIIIAFLSIIYFVVLESSSWSATFGKKLMGIYVITDSGTKLDTGKAIIRNIARQLSGFLFIGYIMSLFTEKTQTLHDKIAKTLVVKR